LIDCRNRHTPPRFPLFGLSDISIITALSHFLLVALCCLCRRFEHFDGRFWWEIVFWAGGQVSVPEFRPSPKFLQMFGCRAESSTPCTAHQHNHACVRIRWLSVMTCIQAALAGGQLCKWNVHASPDGSLEDLSTGREYPYLFWEADSSDGRVSRSFGLDVTRSSCVAGDAAGVFLDGALERLGLNMRERCDMVTYWLPQLESSPFNVIYFVDVNRYEKAARLTIAPAPDVMIRIFMAFRWLDTAKMEDLRAPARKGFVAVEWGGMNLNGSSHD
ncbi:unnamed protein product, partial [Ectocarpus sp. 12 AP-2014]